MLFSHITYFYCMMNMIRSRLLAASVVILVVALTGFGAMAQRLTVATAANVQYVMLELKTAFEQTTGIGINIVSGSSGKLAAQIKEGAPFDVFVSADMEYPEALYKSGHTSGAPKAYARGILVLWSAHPGIQPGKDLQVLQSNATKKIALPNPKTAPYGRAAEEAMQKVNMYDKVKQKLVYGESIAQASQFIATRAADIGFTAKSMVLSGDMKGKGRWVEVDTAQYSPIMQGAVILKHGAGNNKAAAERFYSFLFSQKAKSILSKYGYLVP